MIDGVTIFMSSYSVQRWFYYVMKSFLDFQVSLTLWDLNNAGLFKWFQGMKSDCRVGSCGVPLRPLVAC